MSLPPRGVALKCVEEVDRVGRDGSGAIVLELLAQLPLPLWKRERLERLRDALFNIASRALMNPIKEQRPFSTAPNLRIDLLLRFGSLVTAIDTAITAGRSSAELLAAAIASPGGASTLYEECKVATYGAAADADHITLVPFVADTHGALGSSALPLLHSIARSWGARYDVGPSRSIPLTLQLINVAVMKQVAHLLLCNIGPLPAV